MNVSHEITRLVKDADAQEQDEDIVQWLGRRFSLCKATYVQLLQYEGWYDDNSRSECLCDNPSGPWSMRSAGAQIKQLDEADERSGEQLQIQELQRRALRLSGPCAFPSNLTAVHVFRL